MSLNIQEKKEGFISLIKELIVIVAIVFLIRTFVFGLYQVPTGSMETTILVGERFFADKFTYLFSSPKRNDFVAFNDPTFEYSKNPLKYLWESYVWGPVNWTKRIIATPGQKVKGVIEDGKPVIYVDDKKLDEPYVNKYPLIYVYKESPEVIERKAQEEADMYVAQARLSVSRISDFINHQKEFSSTWLSYDPTKSYADQPFYIINPAWVVKDKPLKEPGTPLKRKSGVKAYRNGVNFYDGTDEFYVELGPDQYWCMGDNRLGSWDSRFLGPIAKKLIHGRIVFRIWSNDSNESWWIIDLIKHPIDFWKRMRWSRFFQRV